MNLIETNKEGAVITLKEITDLIDVRHNDSMKKVKKLAKEPSFGVLRETRITSGETGGRPTATYSLTKKQAIAVGAKLNNKLLMKVIDRLEELESQKPMITPYSKMSTGKLKGYKMIKNLRKCPRES